LVHVSHALNRYLLGTLIVNRFHTGVLLLFHDNFSHRAVLRTATTFCCGKISAIITGLGRAA